MDRDLYQDFFLYIIVVSLIVPVFRGEEPIVKTYLGKIGGAWKTSYGGKRYAAFEGIPYAKPPVDMFRFEEPQPVDQWTGIYHAKKMYTCYQILDKIEGSEDCLYLNVFVPGDFLDNKRTYDVVVTIHGGAFMLGSGQMMANSKFVMDREFIFVTFNYRLGIFGFLSTEDDVIPGNNGLKDQVLAMKWVKLNIASFGGNPNSITLTGVSAGGASVHLHYFSPLSKGLFIRGISHSGTALDPWIIKKYPIQNTKKLALLVGCSDISSQEIKQCLKKKSALDLMLKVKYFYGYGNMPFTPFGPVVESDRSKHPFLTKNPYSMMYQKRIVDLPWITSSCTHEGLLPAAWYYNDRELKNIDRNWDKIAHYLLDYNFSVPIAKRQEVAQQIRDEYMDGHQINKKHFYRFTKIFTERLFTVGSEMAAKLQSKINTSPVYYYFFNYGEGTNCIACNTSIQGVSHAEDANYFYGAFIFREFSEEDKKIRDTCLDILFSFASTGNPATSRAVLWKPTKGDDLAYLNITNSDSMKMNSTKALTRADFWRKIGLLENESLQLAKDEL